MGYVQDLSIPAARALRGRGDYPVVHDDVASSLVLRLLRVGGIQALQAVRRRDLRPLARCAFSGMIRPPG